MSLFGKKTTTKFKKGDFINGFCNFFSFILFDNVL